MWVCPFTNHRGPQQSTTRCKIRHKDRTSTSSAEAYLPSTAKKKSQGSVMWWWVSKYASFPFAGVFIIIITSQKDLSGKLLPVVRGRYLKVWLVYSGKEHGCISHEYGLGRIKREVLRLPAVPCSIKFSSIAEANDTTLSVGLLYVVAKQRDRGARCSLLLSLFVRVACFMASADCPLCVTEYRI